MDIQRLCHVPAGQKSNFLVIFIFHTGGTRYQAARSLFGGLYRQECWSRLQNAICNLHRQHVLRNFRKGNKNNKLI